MSVSRTVIHAECLSKRYHRGALPQGALLRDHLNRALKSHLSIFPRPQDETFWGLKDVTLEVCQGELHGLLGRQKAKGQR